MITVSGVLTNIFRVHVMTHMRQSMDIRQTSWAVVPVMMTVAYSKSWIVLVRVLMFVKCLQGAGLNSMVVRVCMAAVSWLMAVHTSWGEVQGVESWGLWGVEPLVVIKVLTLIRSSEHTLS